MISEEYSSACWSYTLNTGIQLVLLVNLLASLHPCMLTDLLTTEQLLDAHRSFKARACGQFMKLKQSSSSPNGSPASTGAGREGDGVGAASTSGFRQLWAVELSAIAQGIGVTGLIFDLAVSRPRGISEEGGPGAASEERNASFKSSSAIEEVHNYEVR